MIKSKILRWEDFSGFPGVTDVITRVLKGGKQEIGAGRPMGMNVAGCSDVTLCQGGRNLERARKWIFPLKTSEKVQPWWHFYFRYHDIKRKDLCCFKPPSLVICYSVTGKITMIIFPVLVICAFFFLDKYWHMFFSLTILQTTNFGSADFIVSWFWSSLISAHYYFFASVFFGFILLFLYYALKLENQLWVLSPSQMEM